ncbi:MAG: interleukin-like EMT inducer domain-containing protein [Anaerolineae bacterium]
MQISSQHWRRDLAVIGIYALLALVLTWPLPLYFSTHLPGDGGDNPTIAWNLWWVRYALLHQGASPFACDFMFYPIGINLAFYTLTVLNGLISVPLQPIFGLTFTSNLLLISSYALGGYGTYLLLLCILPKERKPNASRFLAAFFGGLAYAFSAPKLFYASLGQFNIASSQWIPFYILFLCRMRSSRHPLREALLASIFLLFQAWAEMTYASFLIIFTALYLLWHLVESFIIRKSGESFRPLVFLGVVGLVFLVGLSPLLYAMIPDLIVEGDFFMSGSGFAEVFSADLLSFFLPTRLHPLLGSLFDSLSFSHDKGQHVFVGYSVLFLACYGLFRLRRKPDGFFWALAAFLFFVLCLGPALQVNGKAVFSPMPFSLLQEIPFFKGNRYPSRLGVMLILALAVLASFGLRTLLENKRCLALQKCQAPTFLAALAMALFLFEHLSIPLPLSNMNLPEVYRAISAEKGDFTVLTLPLGWRNGFRITGKMDTIISFVQFYQTFHEKRILSGNTSRNPEFKFQYFTEAPLINRFIALGNGRPVGGEFLEKDEALAPEVLRFFNVRYIVAHPQAGPEIISYLESVLKPGLTVEKIYDKDGIVAWRVKLPPPPDEVDIDLSGELARLSLGEGWGRPVRVEDGGVHVWAQRREVRLFVPLQGRAQRMSWRAFSPGEGQQVTVVVNGNALRPITLARGLGQYEIEIPAQYVREGLNEIRFCFSRLFPVEEARMSGLGDYTIGETGLSSPADILVESAGEEVGDFGHIYVNGRNVSPEGRGYNLAVIDPDSGAVEKVACFDTHLDEIASQKMASFLEAVPEGKIVAISVADEASRLLTQEAVQALSGIGAEEDLRGKFRWSHAIIGAKGARKGEALERLDPIRPACIHVGQAISEPHLAAAFSHFRFIAEDTEARRTRN